jgi:hypothetical protein
LQRKNFVAVLLDAKGNIKIFRVITDHRFGRMRRLNIVARLRLQKLAEDSGVTPYFIVQLPIYHRRRFKTRNASRRIFRHIARCNIGRLDAGFDNSGVRLGLRLRHGGRRTRRRLNGFAGFRR